MTWQRSILIAAILLFAVVYYGLAFVTLRDLVRRPAVRGLNKTAWALSILCLPLLGAVLYGYFGTGNSPSRASRPVGVEPEFTPFEHLFESDDRWEDFTR
ncbi:MAG: PLD nuclease N-terminal domain-containing protein [Thermomicrobiales bacterium]|nr:PLD nuclease N-terminal domain-containing protein [Thermomicrobiales bacterium]